MCRLGWLRFSVGRGMMFRGRDGEGSCESFFWAKGMNAQMENRCQLGVLIFKKKKKVGGTLWNFWNDEDYECLTWN